MRVPSYVTFHPTGKDDIASSDVRFRYLYCKLFRFYSIVMPFNISEKLVFVLVDESESGAFCVCLITTRLNGKRFQNTKIMQILMI